MRRLLTEEGKENEDGANAEEDAAIVAFCMGNPRRLAAGNQSP